MRFDRAKPHSPDYLRCALFNCFTLNTMANKF